MSFDLKAALYVYAMDYHTGQSSRLYRILSRLSGSLHLSDSSISTIRGEAEGRHWYGWEESNRIYQDLVRRQVQ